MNIEKEMKEDAMIYAWLEKRIVKRWLIEKALRDNIKN